LPVLIAAFAYPLGNQLVQEGKNGGRGWIPPLDDPITNDASARVLLMDPGVGTVLGIAGVLPHPVVPTTQQLVGTAIVAILRNRDWNEPSFSRRGRA
jgi:hypothetical protein